MADWLASGRGPQLSDAGESARPLRSPGIRLRRLEQRPRVGPRSGGSRCARCSTSRTFTEVVKSFVELYKVGIKVFDERGNKLADIKIGNGDFCGYVFSFPEGAARCTADGGAG